MKKPTNKPITQSARHTGWVIECDGKFVAASVLNSYCSVSKPNVMANLIQRMIQEMQLKGGIAADKPVKVWVDDQFGK